MELEFRKQLPEQVATALHREIRKQGWQVLPSYRELCRELEVSQYTLERALATLTREGVLEPARPRSRRVVKDAGGKLPTRRQLVFLTGVPFHMESAVAQKVLGKIRDSVARQGWGVEFLDANAYDLKNPARRLDQLLDGHPKATWLIVNAPAPVIRWAERNDLDCLLLGGQAYETTLPCVTTLRPWQLKQLIDHYASQGFHRIVFPVNERWSDSGRRLRDGVAQIFQERGLAFASNYNLPRVDVSSPELFRADLENLFKVTPPQVLVLESMYTLMMAQSVCLERGLKIPEQIQLVYLGDEPILDWMMPVPPHLEFPVDRFVRTLKRWLALPPEKRPRGMEVLDTKFVTGEEAK